MKNSLFIFFVILTSFFVRSQVSSYTFGTSTGTYTPIVGGSNYDNFTSWTNTNFLDDNNSTALESIGFKVFCILDKEREMYSLDNITINLENIIRK